MRLNFKREFFVPDTYRLLIAEPALGIEVFGDDRNAIAFHGKAQKPAWHYHFSSTERRDARVADFVAGHLEHQARKDAKRKEKAEWQHGLKLGDVFQCSWGYDQTNIDYYEITKVSGKSVEVREIAQLRETTAWEQGECVPAPGHYISEPRRMIPQRGYNGAPVLAVYSFASAHLVAPLEVVPGVKVFQPRHWTAYA